MARFSGEVGYVTQEETTPGVWTSVDKVRTMRGDLIRQNANNHDSGTVNGNVSLNHRVSLVGDAYSFANYFDIKWIKIDGHKWKVTSIEIQRPRIIVTIGGMHNG